MGSSKHKVNKSKAKKSIHLCWTGQFIDFIPGEKSPYQFLSLSLLRVSALDAGAASVARTLTAELDDQPQLRLGKDLRRMMMGYLSCDDWIRVVVKGKVDAATGELTWKAREVVKLSDKQVSQEQRLAKAEAKQTGKKVPTLPSSPEKKQKPIRVMVCQKSSCRKRGSEKVQKVMASALKKDGQAANVKIQATGCLKNCKAGPNVVLLPKAAAKGKELKSRYEAVKPKTASKIMDKLLS